MSAKIPGRLIVFTRFPEPGKSKTRLIPALGKTGAARLQRQMTEHIVATAATLNGPAGLSIEIRYEGGSTSLMREWLGEHFSYRPQGPGDLGLRMARAFDDAFRGPRESAVVIGSDIPGISTDIIQQAFEELRKYDLVMGPARDGGYYLIGMNHTIPADTYYRLFKGVRWGAGDVLSQTLQTAKNAGLYFRLLKSLADVDRPADLHIWKKIYKTVNKPAGLKKISIIIPTLNEAAAIDRTLGRLEGIDSLETIIVDGGSTDRTVALAEARGAKVLQTGPGKAAQMNMGARTAMGEILVFLHADTLVPEDFNHQIVTALNRQGVVAGAFRLAIDSTGAAMRLIERMVYLRSRYLGLPYGDQALFMNKSFFEKVGRFPDVPIMEDFILVCRLKRRGKITILPAAVTTSPRRWLNLGVARTWLINQAIIIAYFLGVAPERMVRWYRREKGKNN